MELHFLGSSDGTPLTKKFELKPDSTIEKTPYPFVKNFDSYTENLRSLSEVADSIAQHAKMNHCLLKGKLTKELNNQSRAGSTDPNTPTDWVCFDLDGVKGFRTIPAFLKALGLSGEPYIRQYSASAGITSDPADDVLNAHIFMQLDKPERPAKIKQWLMAKNLTVPELREQLTLTASKVALRWPLDITVCQNDKLIFIAPPILEGGLTDPYRGKRIKLCR